MADEITAYSSLSIDNGSFTPVLTTGTLSITQTTLGGGSPGMVKIGTSEEAITISDVTTPGWAFIQNVDDTNYVDIGPDSAGSMVPCIRLYPGMGHTISLYPTATWRGQANTAEVNLVFQVFEV